jgi:hypothetical protein
VQQKGVRGPSRAAVVLLALWSSLMVAAVGLAMLTGALGLGLTAGGVFTAAVLYLGVDVDPPAAT